MRLVEHHTKHFNLHVKIYNQNNEQTCRDGSFPIQCKIVFKCERVSKVHLKGLRTASKLIGTPSQRPVAQSCAHPAESIGK